MLLPQEYFSLVERAQMFNDGAVARNESGTLTLVSITAKREGATVKRIYQIRERGHFVAVVLAMTDQEAIVAANRKLRLQGAA